MEGMICKGHSDNGQGSCPGPDESDQLTHVSWLCGIPILVENDHDDA